VNHNWCNGCCLRAVVAFALADNQKVRELLMDLRGDFVDPTYQQEGESEGSRSSRKMTSAQAWARHCEVVLRSNGSLPLSAVFSLVRHRVAELEVQYAPFFALVAIQKAQPPLWPPLVPPLSKAQEDGPGDAATPQSNSEEFRRWVDGKLARLWTDDEVDGNKDTESAQDSEDDSARTHWNDASGKTGSVGLPLLRGGGGSIGSGAIVDLLAVRMSVHGLYECAAALMELGASPAVDHLFTDLAHRNPEPGSSTAGRSSHSLLPWELPWELEEQCASEAAAAGVSRALSLAVAMSRCWLE